MIVGLGNPGKEYENTRHNAGFRFIDAYAKEKNIEINKEKFKGLYTTLNYKNEKILLLKPQKYMNLSGEVIRDFIEILNILYQNPEKTIEDIIKGNSIALSENTITDEEIHDEFVGFEL